MANGRLIVPEGTYPCVNAKGEVLDEPVLLRLSYIAETDDRDRGLVELLVDLQRTIQDTWNKLLEWKNRCLNPQMVAPRGSNMARRDDTPGATWFYTPVGGQKPEWETSAAGAAGAVRDFRQGDRAHARDRGGRGCAGRRRRCGEDGAGGDRAVGPAVAVVPWRPRGVPFSDDAEVPVSGAAPLHRAAADQDPGAVRPRPHARVHGRGPVGPGGCAGCRPSRWR